MAMTFHKEIISSKIDVLVKWRDHITEQRNHMQTKEDEINEVLQLATSWLGDIDRASKVTFKDVNQMIEDVIVFLSDTFIYDVLEKIPNRKQELTARFLSKDSTSTDELLSTFSTSTDQHFPSVSTSTGQHLPEISTPYVQSLTAKYNKLSDELNTVTNQVKLLQDVVAHLTKNSEKISEKQQHMEEHSESFSVQYSKIEQEQIRFETELTNISEKQNSKTAEHDKEMKSLERKIKVLTDAQSGLEKKCHLQQTKIKEQKKHNDVLQKHFETFKNDFNASQENIQEFSTRISLLENQELIESQLETLENKIKFIESSSESLVVKFEKHGSNLEEFMSIIEEDLHYLSLVQGREIEYIEKFEEKITAMEMIISKTSQKTSQQEESDLETKFTMLSQAVDDRLAPLEKLRNIFNRKIKSRNGNIKKLNDVCKQVNSLVPKISQIETHRQGTDIGFSVHKSIEFLIGTAMVLKYFCPIFSNIGNHFDPTTGVFTAPLDGLYATYLSVKIRANGSSEVMIAKGPCISELCSNLTWCKNCFVGEVFVDKDHKNGSVFLALYMKAGEQLCVVCKSVCEVAFVPCNIVFTCFRIG